MIDTKFKIEDGNKRVLFHPKRNGGIKACFLNFLTGQHKHIDFKSLEHARAMGLQWCGFDYEAKIKAVVKRKRKKV